jgi:hypothetical protein
MKLHITPSVILIVIAGMKIINSYIARVTGNHSTSTGPISIALVGLKF